jgi:hypothetical protein
MPDHDKVSSGTGEKRLLANAGYLLVKKLGGERAGKTVEELATR